MGNMSSNVEIHVQVTHLAHAAKDGQAEMGCSRFLWRNTSDHIGAICEGLFDVKGGLTNVCYVDDKNQNKSKLTVLPVKPWQRTFESGLRRRFGMVSSYERRKADEESPLRPTGGSH